MTLYIIIKKTTHTHTHTHTYKERERERERENRIPPSQQAQIASIMEVRNQD